MSKRYVKRVSEIQAIQYNGNNAMEVVEFVGDVIGIDWYENASLEITIDNETIECFKGDYVVKDHKDKIKVYEANEFEKNYSEVEDD
ncbi:hypothetical protein [Veillonella sp.]|uniref:hypothetical protein n=1 Tax=Veillonella sp. TaxID=1926307 RepID=UPI00292EA404|nr:hypothetical protein [Veillonella sp.]